MIHRGGPCGEEGWFGHPQFTAGSPHFQDPFPWIIATESPLWQRIVHCPPKNLALARLHPSKPPSSDIVKPPKPPPPEGQDKRRIGGQPGHPKHERALFPPEQVNGGSHDHFRELCPTCGHGLQPSTAAPRVVQQIEIHEVPLEIEEHCSHPGWCPHRQKVRYAPFPLMIERGGLVGPRLTTLIAYLKGACHASFSTVRKFLRDVVRVTISRGQLVKIIGKGAPENKLTVSDYNIGLPTSWSLLHG